MRDITKLHPDLQTKIPVLVSECKKQGLIIGIGECLRTVSEQNDLYAKGRTAGGSVVTNAKGTTYSSMHQWGVAVDFYRNDGKGAFNDSDGFFTKVGKIGQSIGLEWGGSWKSIKDKPHFQLADWGSTTSKLKKMYGTPEKFMATWSVVEEKEEPQQTESAEVKVVQAWCGAKQDGFYGKDTKALIVKKLQPYLGMPKTGIVNDDLLKRIKTVKQGDKGEIVKCMEALLFCKGYNPQDFKGNFNEKVTECVEKFQTDHKLEADKLAGKLTWTELLK